MRDTSEKKPEDISPFISLSNDYEASTAREGEARALAWLKIAAQLFLKH